MLFTPLLASTASGTLELRSIAQPIRQSAGPEVDFVEGKAVRVDVDKRQLWYRPTAGGVDYPGLERSKSYDLMVLGVGAQSNTFGLPGVHAGRVHFMKELSDARNLRQAILRKFEWVASAQLSDAEAKAALAFVFVGGGPTGAECAAEVHDLIFQDLARMYSARVMDAVSVHVVDGKELLGGFDEKLQAYAKQRFQRQSIHLHLGKVVAGLEDDRVCFTDGTSLPYGVCVWATGVAPRKFTRLLSHREFKRSKSGRVQTDEWLRVLRGDDATPQLQPGVFALGDCADVGSAQYAATAQVAEQQGKYLARTLNDLAHRGQLAQFLEQQAHDVPAGRFEYHHAGSLAYLGGFTALSDFTQADAAVSRATGLSGKRLTGWLAWLTWRSVYLTQQGTWRNRLQVPMDWTRTLIFGRDTNDF